MVFIYSDTHLTSAIEDSFDKAVISEKEKIILLDDIPLILESLNRKLFESEYPLTVNTALGVFSIGNKIYNRIYSQSSSKKLLYEAWRNSYGNLHSFRDKPAVINYGRETQKIIAERWCKNNLTHRGGDKPALKLYTNKGGILEIEEWYINGARLRYADKPNVVFYHSNGTVEMEEWWDGITVSRGGDLPASIKYYDDGNLRSEEWLLAGEPYRDNNNDPVNVIYKNSKGLYI